MSIEEKFLAAVNVIESLPSDGTFQPSEDLMLKLYAYYMQATEGPCKTSKPSIWNYSSRSKWIAWYDLGKMEREAAMEKYVEELTKVIETMSYNENVSKFMSLIGPFYEIVTPEEIDQLSEKDSSKKISPEYVYPVKKLEDLHLPKIKDSSRKNANDFLNLNSSNVLNTETFKKYKYDISIGSPKFEDIPQKHVIDIFKAKNNKKHQPFGSQQDILILTFINLQNSLKEIVQKLENLQCLAKSADFNLEADDGKTFTEWNLGCRGTIFTLLWPIALHLYSRRFLKHM